MVAAGADILQPTSAMLLEWGANYKPFTLGGQWWRLLTACFLHIGVVHLLLNMYALFSIGFLLEPYLGRRRFLAAYVLTGLVASLTSLWWHKGSVSAGASGAIFGMYGVFLALLTTDLIDSSARRPLLISIILFTGYNLLGGLKEGIDNAAHVGGLISGAAIGYAFLPSLKHPDSQALKFGTLLLVNAVVLTALAIGYRLIG
jgi:rhomboid protease GluP